MKNCLLSPSCFVQANPRSILDRDAGAKALLEMIDRGHHSEGLREPDPID